jgi:hypothetical protein
MARSRRDVQRRRPLASREARGYGPPHRKLRAQWAPRVAAGHVACHAAICLEVRDGRSRMIAPGTPWHLGHTPDRSGWTGPEHERCGAADGARRGNQMRPRAILAAGGRDIICGACGKPYHYAARSCEICGVHYHPSGKAVRTCSRAHGVELRRRLYGHAGKSLPKPKPPPQPHVTYVLDCQQCGNQFTARQSGAKFCSLKCRNASRFPSLRYCGCGQQLLPGRHRCDDCKKSAGNALVTSRRW